jgi:hypothetical protein
MSCEECKEQVFELIEREATDPDGVREILARCPDCRALFDEMKAALAVAAELPVEEPPAAIDSMILRAAAERRADVVRQRRRWSKPLPWAFAAAALLALGFGIRSIPRTMAPDREAAATELAEASEEAIAAPRVVDDETKRANAVAKTEPAIEPERARASRPKKEAVAELRKDLPNAPVTARPATRSAAGAAPESLPVEADGTAYGARDQEQAGDATAICQRKLGEMERRGSDDQDVVTDPEEQLAIGKCYRRVGNLAEARRWLERAAKHPRTRSRAEKVLGELAPR